MARIFSDRTEAGRQLAQSLMRYAHRTDAIVLAIPRGGVPVGFEVAQILNLAFDIFIVHKLGVPWQSELALGAIASGGTRVLNEDVIAAYCIPPEMLAALTAIEMEELQCREKLLRGARPQPEVAGRIVIAVDDGLATGASMKAAVLALRALQPKQIVVAAPVAAPDTAPWFQDNADDFVCLEMPPRFMAVGLWYRDFEPVTDNEVRSLLEQAEHHCPYSADLLR